MMLFIAESEVYVSKRFLEFAFLGHIRIRWSICIYRRFSYFLSTVKKVVIVCFILFDIIF